jgi:hypothetical protein
MTRLDRVSIADLCHRAEEHGVPSEGQQRERVVDYAV